MTVAEAPQTPPRALDEPGARRRSLNERVVLTQIRRRGPQTKAELARLTGLSATAVGGIVRALEEDGLVRPEARRMGRVGQPSTPYALDPEGGYALGLKIGRRSAEMVLLDACLRVVEIVERRHDFPKPDALLAFASEAAERFMRPRRRRARLYGVGAAAPSDLWAWADEMAAPPGAMGVWRDLDFGAALTARLGAQAVVINDATAACAAQLALDPGLNGSPLGGAGRDASADDGAVVDFVHFFVGWFVGGGVVIDGRVRQGRRQRAGALGSMPVRIGDETCQLIHAASLRPLEAAAVAQGTPPETLWSAEADWSSLGDTLERWLDQAADAIAHAAASAASVMDFEAAVIDGSFPVAVRRALTDRTRARLAALAADGLLQGLAPLTVREGSVGRHARAVGAACLPLIDAFAVDAASI